MRTRPLPALLVLVVALLAGALPAGAATGPDVSRYQHPDGGPVDWVRVASSGQDFTYVKATEGTAVTNAWYDADAAAARAAGLYVGGYHFARPSTAPGSAAAQADAFAARLGDQQRAGTLPPALDLESSGGLSVAALQAWTRAFLGRLEQRTGRRPVLYTYPSFWQTAMGGTSAFAGYPLWIAHYTGAPQPTHTGWPAWTFWQYSSTATVSGVSGPVDMNRFAGSDADLARLALAQVPPDAGTGVVPTGLSPGALEVAADTAPGRWSPLPPVRVLDTRGGSRVAAQVTVELPEQVPASAAGVVLSVSAVAPAGPGWVRAAAAGTTPRTTALNHGRGSSTGLVVARTDGARRVTLSVGGAPTHLVADLVGVYDTVATGGGTFTPLPPARVLDTRRDGGAPRTGEVRLRLPDEVPAGSTGAVLDVSLVDPVHDTYVRLDGATVLNAPGHASRTGLVLTGPGRDVVLTVVGGPAHVVVDLLGVHGGDAGARYVGSTPTRVVDTRTGLGGAPGARTVTVQLPPAVEPGATALLDVSAVAPTGTCWLRVGPAGEEPETTALSADRSSAQTGLVLTRVDAQRRVTLALHGAAADLVVDLVGRYTSGTGAPANA